MPESSSHSGALRATLTGALDLLRPAPRLDLPAGTRLDGRTALVTGATRGLGRATARALVDLGATVLGTGRTGLDEAAAATGAELLRVDLAEPASVDALADALRDRGVRLDVLVLNAGIVPLSARTTSVGTDLMDHVHLLANVQLVDRLLVDGTLRDGARVVVVGSESHRSATLDPDHLLEPHAYGTRDVVAEYGRSKLLLHTWTVELARRLEGRVAVHHLCPGAIRSDIAREAPGFLKPALALVFRAFFQPPERAARPVVWLASAPDVGAPTGVYLHLTRRREPSAAARDPALGRAVWDAAHAVIARFPRP